MPILKPLKPLATATLLATVATTGSFANEISSNCTAAVCPPVKVPDKIGEPIREIKDLQLNRETTLKRNPFASPFVASNEEEAKKLFDEKSLEKLKKEVDFEKQIVVVFSWRGSGGDKIQSIVQESFPERVRFSRKQGLTRDLKHHVHVFVLRNNVRWTAQSYGTTNLELVG